MSDKPARICILILAALTSFLWFRFLYKTVNQHSIESQTHWIGRAIVGDGANHGVSFNNIEIGMREDGVMVWRMWQTNVVKAIPLMSGGQKQ